MCTALQEREREFWQGLRTAPDPEGYCSTSFMLYRDITSETLGPVSLLCQIFQNPTGNPPTSGSTPG